MAGAPVGEHVKSMQRCPILWRAGPTAVGIRCVVGVRCCCLIDPVVRMPTIQTTETDGERTPTPVGINQLLDPERIRIRLPGGSKPEVIDALIDLLDGEDAIKDLEAVRSAIFEREEKMSTGVGKGLGLPHAKTSAATDTLLAFATTEEPIDFGAVDDVPVRLLLLLVGPEEHKSQHVKILGRISRLISRDSLRQRLLEAESAQTIISTLREGERDLRS